MLDTFFGAMLYRRTKWVSESNFLSIKYILAVRNMSTIFYFLSPIVEVVQHNAKLIFMLSVLACSIPWHYLSYCIIGNSGWRRVGMSAKRKKGHIESTYCTYKGAHFNTNK